MTFQKGYIPWNKGLKYTASLKHKLWRLNNPEKVSELKKNLTGHNKPHTEETKKKISEKIKQGFIEGRKTWNLGQTKENDSRIYSGEKHHRWKGGVTKVNTYLRKTPKYKNWRTSVFERDNYKCVLCGTSNAYLNADHIKPFSMFPELRYEISNGRTLCVPCHLKTDTHGIKALKFEERVEV